MGSDMSVQGPSSSSSSSFDSAGGPGGQEAALQGQGGGFGGGPLGNFGGQPTDRSSVSNSHSEAPGNGSGVQQQTDSSASINGQAVDPAQFREEMQARLEEMRAQADAFRSEMAQTIQSMREDVGIAPASPAA
jgi:hypothetical protein